NLSLANASQSIPLVGGPLDGKSLNVQLFSATRPLATAGYNNAITEIASKVKSEYNAFVAQVSYRLAHDVLFQANYTLSNATDTLQTSTTSTSNNTHFNVFDPEADRGRSNYDRRHKFVLSAVLAPRVKTDNKFATVLFDGWSIAPVVQIFSGL